MVESWRSAVAAGDPVWQHAARANLAAWRPHHARLKAVLSHEGPVDAAAFSPDGKTVLTGGDDRTARLWDVATGQPIGQPIRHEGVVTCVAFSPDGKTILTGSSGQDGAALGCRHRPTRRIALPAWGRGHGAWRIVPTARPLLTGSADNMARLWDAATHRPIGQPFVHQTVVESVAFSPDGKSLLTGSWDDGAALGRRHRPPIGSPLQASANVVCAWRSAPTASPSHRGL